MYWNCFQRFLESLTFGLIFNLDFAENFVSSSYSYYPGQLENPALEEYQKVRIVYPLILRILRKKLSFLSEMSVIYRRALKTCASLELAHGACQRAQEHLLTPSELGDRASQSWEPVILTEILYVFTKDIHIRYSENTRSISDIFEADHAHNS